MPSTATSLHRFKRGMTEKVDSAARSRHIEPIMQETEALFEAARAADAAGDRDHVAALLFHILAREPDHADAKDWVSRLASDDFRRACELLEADQTGDAWPVIRRYIALQPKDGEGWFLAAIAQRRLRDLTGLIHSAEHAITLLPGDLRPINFLAEALAERGEFAATIDLYDALLTLSPANARAHTNLIFALNFLPDADTARQQAERRRWDDLHGSGRYGRPVPPDHSKDANRPLRIGYVTSFFRHQAATFAFAPLLLEYDRTQFSVFCYSATIDGDALTERFRAAASGWRDIAGLSDDAVADLVRQDQIDILVDCAGHMAGHRLGVFVRKPAPVQVTAWGEPTGTGLAAMDWLLADPVLVPVADRPLLVEKIWDLPCFLGYWSPTPLPAVAPLPAQERGFVTFGSFNRTAKLTDQTLILWAEVLKAVPGSRLLLKDRDFYYADQRERVLTILGAAGVDPARIDIVGALVRQEHFALYGDIDIALDPTPHGGGMTTLDSLWMGVPVLTWPQHSISSRLAASCLTAVGLPDWIAANPAAYVARAQAAAADLPALAELRQQLRPRMAAGPVGDPAQWVAAVELAYRGIWRQHCLSALITA